MKVLLCAASLCWLASAGLAQTPDSSRSTANSNELDDVVVQEKFEDEFIDDKFPVSFEVDFSGVVAVDERVNWKSLDVLFEKDANALQNIMPVKLSSAKFAAIQPQPVKRFLVQLESVSRWHLDIISNDGSLFRRMRGQGNPPQIIPWDGLGDDGQPLVAGQSYSYSMTAVDKAGNKRTFTGRTFSVPAFYLQSGEAVIVGLACQDIFAGDELGLRPEANSLAKEVASLIRLTARKGQISYASANPNVRDFLSLVADALVVNNDIFWHIRQDDMRTDCLYLYIE